MINADFLIPSILGFVNSELNAGYLKNPMGPKRFMCNSETKLNIRQLYLCLGRYAVKSLMSVIVIIKV